MRAGTAHAGTAVSQYSTLQPGAACCSALRLRQLRPNQPATRQPTCVRAVPCAGGSW